MKSPRDSSLMAPQSQGPAECLSLAHRFDKHGGQRSGYSHTPYDPSGPLQSKVFAFYLGSHEEPLESLKQGVAGAELLLSRKVM